MILINIKKYQVFSIGCWDIFCIICGNTCHSMCKETDKFFLENIESYDLHKKSKNDIVQEIKKHK
jgi:hypothetical protein